MQAITHGPGAEAVPLPVSSQGTCTQRPLPAQQEALLLNSGYSCGVRPPPPQGGGTVVPGGGGMGGGIDPNRVQSPLSGACETDGSHLHPPPRLTREAFGHL